MTTPKPETDGATERPWHTDKYHLYIWGPQEQMIGDSRLDDAKAECPEETGTPILRARGGGAKLPINANMDFIIESVNSHDTLKSENARLREQVKELREGVDLIARDLPARGPQGFEDFSTAYSRIKHAARDLLEKTNA